MNYWLHRISYEWDVSHALLEKGYLSIGWGDFYNDPEILNAANEDTDAHFREITQGLPRGRWSLWYFARIKAGDIIVVPGPGTLTLVEALGSATSVRELPSSVLPLSDASIHQHRLDRETNNGGYLYAENQDGTERDIDLGFVLPVRVIKTVRRSAVLADLASRAKIRCTTANISDLKASVDNALTLSEGAKLPALSASLVENILTAIHKCIKPEQLESLVRWYMETQYGANAWIPAKNDQTKEDGADADVIAEIGDLDTTVCIQIKKNEGVTDERAVTQISLYVAQKQNELKSTNVFAWVISTADSFSEKARSLAEEKKVRLINGKEFAEMLFNCDLSDLDSAFL